MKTIPSDKKIGLALSGGSVLGSAHIGVLKALKESEVEVDYIAGTSIGGLVAAFYAFGKSCEEMEGIAENIQWIDITKISLSNYALLSNEKLGQLIIDNLGEVSFSDSDIPFAVIATDIANGEKIIINEGNLKKAVMSKMFLSRR
jgi:NTE family protein